MGEEALFESGQKHHRKLEALGGVQRHEMQAVVARAGLLLAGLERGVREEGGERRAGVLFSRLGERVDVLFRGARQLLQVLGPGQGAVRIFEILPRQHAVLEQGFLARVILFLLAQADAGVLDRGAFLEQLQGLVGVGLDDGHQPAAVDPVPGLEVQGLDHPRGGRLHLDRAHQLDAAGLGELVDEVAAFDGDRGKGLHRGLLAEVEVDDRSDGPGRQGEDHQLLPQ